MINANEIRAQGEAALGKYLKPSAEDMITALRICAVDEPRDTYPCKDCYLYPYSRDGHMSTGRTCFEHLTLDVIKEFKNRDAEIARLRTALDVEAKRKDEAEEARDEWERFSDGTEE